MSNKKKPLDKNESGIIVDANRLCLIIKKLNTLPLLQLLRDTSGNKVSGNQNKRRQITTHESLKSSAIERTTSALLATTTVYIIYRRLAVAQCWMRDTTAFCSNVQTCGIAGFWLGVTVETLLHVFGLFF